MGCAASAPQDADTLPIKAQCRTAFSRCSTTERVVGQASERNLANHADQGHDIVLCYPPGGTVFGLELQARYEKMESVSLWTGDHFPGTPVGISKSVSADLEPALEIKPAPEAAAVPMSSSGVLSREIRMCRRGVVVLVTAGCTWDDGVLNCLRLAGKFVRPLVMVHCVQSCPLPALEEWPQDIRSLIAASGPPVKYLSQHSTEALRDVELRMLAAAKALTAPGAEAEGTNQQQQHWQLKAEKQQLMQLQAAPIQQPAVVASRRCNCLVDTMCASPVPTQRQAAQSQPSLAAQPHGAELCSAGCPVLMPSAAPLSLRALQAANPEICRRALQLLGPWTHGKGATPAGGFAVAAAGAAVAGRGSNCTPGQALLVSGMPSCNGLPAARLQLTPSPESAMRQHQQHGPHVGEKQQQAPRVEGSVGGHNMQWRPADVARSRADAADVTSGAISGAQCVLRYRDPGWATVVAFVCAQLEGELGRANVTLQVAAGATALMGVALPSGWQPSPGLATGTSMRLSLQYMDSGGHNTTAWRQQQQHQVTPTVVPDTASACQGSQRSRSPGSSCCCSASASGGAPHIESVSEVTSRRTSSPTAACADDDVEPFARPSEDDDCTTTLLTMTTRGRSCSGSGRQKNTYCTGGTSNGGGGASLLPDTQLTSWGDGDSKPRSAQQGRRKRRSGGDAASPPSVCLVYFMSPGMSVPLGCLTEVGAGVTHGQRILLVVDGECCQQLPEYAPSEMTPEAWKAIKQLWRERLLYVSDYHASFCALLKQGVTAAMTTAQS